MLNSVIDRGVHDSAGLHVQISCPEFFQRQDFIDYITKERVFTWHQPGEKPSDWSDVVVLVEPCLNGEGDSADMPEDLWDTIIETLKAKFGPEGTGIPSFASHMHIAVRLTNL